MSDAGSIELARRVVRWDGFGLLCALLVLLTVLSLTASNFATTENVLNVLQQSAYVGIIACGMTLVIVAGEIDISVASQAAFSSALLGVLSVDSGVPLGLAVVLVVVQGTVVGLAAGFVRARWNVPSFIVTLALFSMLRGAAQLITNAYPIAIADDSFAFLGSGKLLGVPVPAVIMLVVFAVGWAVAARTYFGRSVYAVGGNPRAARLSGIPVARTRVLVFAITGGLAALTGVLISAQLSAGNANIGVGLEFDVISAAIIGGASLFGGKGSIVGTLLGVLFISFLGNGMVLLGVNPFAQEVARGAIVLAAVLVSVLRQPRSA